MLTEEQEYQLKKLKLQYEHEEKLRDIELGLLGKIFGG